MKQRLITLLLSLLFFFIVLTGLSVVGGFFMVLTGLTYTSLWQLWFFFFLSTLLGWPFEKPLKKGIRHLTDYLSLTVGKARLLRIALNTAEGIVEFMLLDYFMTGITGTHFSFFVGGLVFALINELLMEKEEQPAA
ncbi:YrvL family regulatory protein [Enterococcus nangangensis]